MTRLSTKPTFASIQAELADPDYKVRKVAIKKLMRYQRPYALEPLLGLLGDARGDVRSKVVEALGRLADKRALVPLLGLLNDKNMSVRAKVAGALGNFGERSAVQPLHDLFNDSQPLVRRAVARSLGRLRDPGSLPLLLAYLEKADDADIHYVVLTLGDFDMPCVIEPLLALCEHAQWVQGTVASALSKLGESATPTLVEIMLDQERTPMVRSCVALACGIKWRSGVVQPLIAVLADRAATVRQFAARSLGSLKNPAAIEPLTRMLPDSDEGVSCAVIYALLQLNATTATDAVIACLASPHEYVVYTAANALRQFKATSAVPVLLDILCRSEGNFNWPLARALSELGSPALVDEILRHLPEIGHMQLKYVIAILCSFADKRAVEPLLTLLAVYPVTDSHDYHLQVELVSLLGKLGDERACEPLRQMLSVQTERGVLRDTLISALKKLEAAQRQATMPG
ncbi:MAG TPA: HEAT repeat domain-containing protein [Ktedonobacteraceae bacterium]